VKKDWAWDRDRDWKIQVHDIEDTQVTGERIVDDHKTGPVGMQTKGLKRGRKGETEEGKEKQRRRLSKRERPRLGRKIEEAKLSNSVLSSVHEHKEFRERKSKTKINMLHHKLCAMCHAPGANTPSQPDRPGRGPTVRPVRPVCLHRRR
jgi:hypothetical protein